MDILKECSGFVRSIYERHRAEHKRGDPIVFMRGYPDYDYMPTDIDQIDKIIVEMVGDWVEICRDIDNGGMSQKDIVNIWCNARFPVIIFKSVLVIEYYNKKADIDCDVIMSGVLDEIEMEAYLISNYSLYTEIFELVEICWLPVNRPDLFTVEVVNKMENLLLRVGLMLANNVGKNRRNRFDIAKMARDRSIKGGGGVKDGSKRDEIREKCKELAGKGVSDRDIASMVAADCGVSDRYVRKIRVEIENE